MIIGLLIPVTVASLMMLDQRKHVLSERLEADHRRLADILALGMQRASRDTIQQSGEHLRR